MVDRTKMTDQECIDSLVDCYRVVEKTERELELYKLVLEASKNEFIRRFTNKKQ